MIKMFWLKKILRKHKDEKFQEKYPFLILDPRVPMEEELGIQKEDVLQVYNNYVLVHLNEELKKLGFKQRGKTQQYYLCLDYGIVAYIEIHRSIKSFSIFDVYCGFTCLSVELERWKCQYGNPLLRYTKLPPYSFDTKDEVVAKQSCEIILQVIQNEVLPLAESLKNFENAIKLLGRITSFGDWDTALCLCLREGKMEAAKKELINIKKNNHLNNPSLEDSYNEYVKDKLQYYEKLIEKGKDVCIKEMLDREKQNKKKYKIK